MAEENKKAVEKTKAIEPNNDNKKAIVKKSAKKSKKPNIFKRIFRFFKELKSEVSKVVWPTPKQVVNNTITVLVITLISAVFVGVIDTIFKEGVALLLKIGG